MKSSIVSCWQITITIRILAEFFYWDNCWNPFYSVFSLMNAGFGIKNSGVSAVFMKRYVFAYRIADSNCDCPRIRRVSYHWKNPAYRYRDLNSDCPGRNREVYPLAYICIKDFGESRTPIRWFAVTCSAIRLRSRDSTGTRTQTPLKRLLPI